ncbi:PP0621 family protein [Acidovorax sp.]|uniref:PP0621 family protein n=1 Tax=Acidovorax sp. TaxID=1872122 RepID=UPI00391D9FFB
MKYLLLLVVLLVAFGIWRSRRPSDTAAPRQHPQTPALPQDMLACAHCGVHVPRSDALMLGSDAYCCAEHQRLGPA